MRTLSLIVVASLLLGTPRAFAQAVPASRENATPSSPRSSLLAQASRETNRFTLSEVSGQDQTPPNTTAQPDEESIKKRALVLGLAGVGTAAAGAMLWSSAPESNLPGISSGRATTGQIMVGVGGILGTLGLMRAFR